MIDMNEELEFAIDLARGAGKILMKHFGKLTEVKSKGMEGLLTIADTESDEFIRKMIEKEYPDHDILAEESAPTMKEDPADFLWIIDPLDGTTNFSKGNPFFAVSIALAYKKRSVLGVVYVPYLNELFYNKGNEVFMNGKKVSASKNNMLMNSVIHLGFNSYNPKDVEDGMKILNAFAKTNKIRLRMMGCASLSIAYVAAGRADAAIDPHLKPWDMAAAGLFVEKVGKITDIKGSEWNPFSRGAIASNGRIHKEILEILNKIK
jgi:myo-inositol-1(or 4)-monophosphatase